ncbi:glycerate kinase [Zhihengliuella flava]|uniref:Glycerate kinase n=1 Tax=Zhihengliuella flava TaxID=1285193 RepID=A0A931GEY3_9MICC|nr:glycerate kinase [Zhihengliuella flava]
MDVLIAPDKFKGTLAAADVAAAVASGLQESLPQARTTAVPVADGGEGTVAAALSAGYRAVSRAVTGPLSATVEASFAVSGHTAVVELAAASGLDLVPAKARDAGAATSRGTGELIGAALDAGARRIILGVGGSACTDGGAGLLSALGVRLLDARGRVLPDGGAALNDLACVDVSGLDPRLEGTEVVLASDVDNPLLGARGAAAVFGPQKGASPEDVRVLESGLARLVDVLERVAGPEPAAAAKAPGAGSAGGVGFAALALLSATRRRGIEVVMELTGFDAALAAADVVITGEGRLDAQTLEGKAPAGVAAAAAARGLPVYAVCGRRDLDAQALTAAGITAALALTDVEPDVAACLANPAPLLRELGRRIGAQIAAGDREPLPALHP